MDFEDNYLHEKFMKNVKTDRNQMQQRSFHKQLSDIQQYIECSKAQENVFGTLLTYDRQKLPILKTQRNQQIKYDASPSKPHSPLKKVIQIRRKRQNLYQQLQKNIFQDKCSSPSKLCFYLPKLQEKQKQKITKFLAESFSERPFLKSKYSEDNLRLKCLRF